MWLVPNITVGENSKGHDLSLSPSLTHFSISIAFPHSTTFFSLSLRIERSPLFWQCDDLSDAYINTLPIKCYDIFIFQNLAYGLLHQNIYAYMTDMTILWYLCHNILFKL